MRGDRQRALRLLNVVLIVCVQAYVVEASQQGSFAVPVRRMPAARRGRLLQEANAPAAANATAIRVRQMYNVVSKALMALTLAGGQQFELEVDTGRSQHICRARVARVSLVALTYTDIMIMTGRVISRD